MPFTYEVQPLAEHQLVIVLDDVRRYSFGSAGKDEDQITDEQVRVVDLYLSFYEVSTTNRSFVDVLWDAQGFVETMYDFEEEGNDDDE